MRSKGYLLGIILIILLVKPQNITNYMFQVLIAIRELHSPHSRENQAEVIIQVIKDYALERKIRYFVIDNITNNDIAINIVLKTLLPYLSTEARTGQRLWCLRHVINLSVKAFLYRQEQKAFKKGALDVKEGSDLLKELQLQRKRGLVERLYNIIIFIYYTS